jgi:2-polyprenyl-3-methyl-5-hydroxy-6-metoxy-1,4-benzoquinol methylase
MRNHPHEGPVLDDLTARSLWDESADAWDRFVEEGFDHYRIAFHGPALLEACGAMRGLDVLDLGCGQGWFSRQLARRAARVIGIDWSPRMIAHARRHEEREPLGVSYETLDAARIDERFDSSSFDLLTACMSLMDMPQPGRVLASARPLLRREGRIVLSIPNPVTDATFRQWERDERGNKLSLKIDRYFDAASSVLRWDSPRLPESFRTVQYRHTLEQWSLWLEEAGLIIRRLREPRPTPEALALLADLEDATRVPYFLVLDLAAR